MRYAKVIDNKPVLYFQYVPPYTLKDQASSEQLKRLSYIGAELHEGSVYYYWWAFLRLNAEYIECCENGGAGRMAALYEDFGDVRSNSFWNWWIGGGRMLFCEPPEDEILSPPHIPADDDASNRVLLSIPVTGDLDRTMTELRKILKPAFDEERKHRRENGQSESGYSRARYQVRKNTTPESLYARLKVWEAKKNNPDASNFVIGVESGIVDRLADNSGSADLTNVVGATVSRYIKEAKALIYNVGEGRFPDFSGPSKAENR